MASTDKQNFRCDTESRWLPFKAQVEYLRREGYLMPDGSPIDMTALLNAEIERVIEDATEATVERLGLVRRVLA